LHKKIPQQHDHHGIPFLTFVFDSFISAGSHGSSRPLQRPLPGCRTE
jgi:hypothetical protein